MRSIQTAIACLSCKEFPLPDLSQPERPAAFVSRRIRGLRSERIARLGADLAVARAGLLRVPGPLDAGRGEFYLLAAEPSRRVGLA